MEEVQGVETGTVGVGQWSGWSCHVLGHHQTPVAQGTPRVGPEIEGTQVYDGVTGGYHLPPQNSRSLHGRCPCDNDWETSVSQEGLHQFATLGGADVKEVTLHRLSNVPIYVCQWVLERISQVSLTRTMAD